jgi:TonB family protein
MRPALLTALAFLGAGAFPGLAGAEPASVLTRAPVVTEDAAPEYPAEARALGLTGAVTLELELSAQGEVTDAVVTAPAGHGFDEAALDAARRLRFSPAEIDGKPSPVRIEYRFTFTLTAAPAPDAGRAAEAPPPANLRGRVLERGTRLPVAAALVQAAGRSAYTDADGRFELAVPDGTVQVVVTEAAHARTESDEEVSPGKATQVTYYVRRTVQGDYEATVVGKRDREVSQVAISAGEIRKIPGASGDAVKVIRDLPGVARTPPFSGQLVIRGGNPRDTTVYIDDHEVPQVFHFGGITSVYASELVKDVELEAGNFGVRSGRAIGGRVNIVTRDPGERTHVVGDVNLYQATALWEGRPSENVGLAVAARRSYADAIVTAAAQAADNGPHVSVAPRYYDFQTKAAWKAGPADTLRLDVFGSSDKMVLTGVKTGGLRDLSVLAYQTQFYDLNARWDHRFDEDTRLHVALGGGYQDTTAQVSDVFQDRDSLWVGLFRTELTRQVAPWLRVTTGVDGRAFPSATIHVTAPSVPPPGQVPSPNDPPRRLDLRSDGVEAGAFVEAALEPVKGLTVVPGVRADVSRTLKTLSWVDPRLAVRWQLGPGSAVKAAAGLYHQAPPLVYLTREWGNPALTEEAAWQYSVGLERRFTRHLSLDAELYYKRLFHLSLPTDATVVRGGQTVAERYVSAGSGDAYGAELLLRWDPDGRFFGWVSYSLSRSKRDQAVAGGSLQRQGNAYDQPNNLVAVGTVELPELWEGLSAGFKVQYTSGNPYEKIHGAVFDADADRYQAIETGRLGSRMPDFFQLDLRADKKWTHPRWTFSTYLEVQNVTNRKNPEAAAYNFDFTQQGWVSGLPLFPSFGLRFEY